MTTGSFSSSRASQAGRRRTTTRARRLRTRLATGWVCTIPSRQVVSFFRVSFYSSADERFWDRADALELAMAFLTLRCAFLVSPHPHTRICSTTDLCRNYHSAFNTARGESGEWMPYGPRYLHRRRGRPYYELHGARTSPSSRFLHILNS